jgi:hypothetical protein
MPERPITILDGFYRGGDRCLQALQHDQVTIVTGGVGITPFLSMIPAIFQALREQEDNFLKKIDIHWSCREAGLETFVVQEYLNDIISQAKGVLEAFTVTVYRTGGKSLKTNSSHLDTLKQSSSSLMDCPSFDSKERESNKGASSTDHEQDAVGLGDEESVESLYELGVATLNDEKHAKKRWTLKADNGSSSHLDTLKQSSTLLKDDPSFDSKERKSSKGASSTDHEQDAVGFCDEESVKTLYEEGVATLTEETHAKKRWTLKADKGSSSHLDTLKQSSTFFKDGPSFDSEGRESSKGTSSTDLEHGVVGLGEEESSATLNEQNVSRLNEDKHAKKKTVKLAGGKVETEHGKGFAMELARMMPGRFAQVRRNIPLFIAFSGMVWLFFHFTFFPYADVKNTFAQMSDETWITILLIVFCFACGVAIEAMVLLFRTHWPAPRPAAFDVVTYENSGIEGGESSLHHVCGRPTHEALFAQAQSATAPGIFMCGAEGLCAIVKKRARQENSYFGRTRYCLYEEAFEM